MDLSEATAATFSRNVCGGAVGGWTAGPASWMHAGTADGLADNVLADGWASGVRAWKVVRMLWIPSSESRDVFAKANLRRQRGVASAHAARAARAATAVGAAGSPPA